MDSLGILLGSSTTSNTFKCISFFPNPNNPHKADISTCIYFWKKKQDKKSLISQGLLILRAGTQTLV